MSYKLANDDECRYKLIAICHSNLIGRLSNARCNMLAKLGWFSFFDDLLLFCCKTRAIDIGLLKTINGKWLPDFIERLKASAWHQLYLPLLPFTHARSESINANSLKLQLLTAR